MYIFPYYVPNETIYCLLSCNELNSVKCFIKLCVINFKILMSI